MSDLATSTIRYVLLSTQHADKDVQAAAVLVVRRLAAVQVIPAARSMRFLPSIIDCNSVYVSPVQYPKDRLAGVLAPVLALASSQLWPIRSSVLGFLAHFVPTNYLLLSAEQVLYRGRSVDLVGARSHCGNVDLRCKIWSSCALGC